MGLMTRHGQISPLFPGEGEGVRGGVNHKLLLQLTAHRMIFKIYI